jgi:hypothetical protein
MIIADLDKEEMHFSGLSAGWPILFPIEISVRKQGAHFFLR